MKIHKIILTILIFLFFNTFAHAKTYALGNIEDTSPVTIQPPKYTPANKQTLYCIGSYCWYSSSSALSVQSSATDVITLPTEKDWSDIVTPVKDQGSCGSCVIFSTTAALESALLKQKKGTFDISEQYSLSCLMPQTLCQTGAQFSSYLEPLKSNGTSQELSQYPYIAPILGNCNAAGKFLTPYNFAYKVKSFEKVGIKSADDLKATLVKYGPVTGAIKVYSSFYDYTSGLYKPSQNEQYQGGHAILIVGYSDKIGGFKVKNSWGTSWGDKGFVWIAYDQVGGKSDLGTLGGGVFAITDASAPDVAPTYVINSSNVTPTSGKSGSSFQFSATLNMALPSGYSVKIDLGSGVLSQMSMFVTATNYSLSRNLTNTGTYTYKIGIYDSRDILQGVISSGTYTVESAAPVVTTGYTKIANNGSVLSDNAKLGSNPQDWACTKDNKTGLIWEVKTTDGGLRDSAKTYTWDKGNDFASSVNSQSLCGSSNWRMPTKDELAGLVYCSDSKTKTLGKEETGYICSNYSSVTRPTINTTYFPNTQSWFWSSSPNANDSSNAWFFNFYYGGGSTDNDKSNNYSVRLVRNSSNSPVVNPTPTPVVPTVTNVAPTLKLISNSPDAVLSALANYTVGVPYNVTVQANDTDGNLKSVDIDWGDGAKESSAQSNGGVQIPFTHTYTSAGNYTWKVIAYDTNGSSSSSVSKWLNVTNPTVPVVIGFAAPKLLTPENNANLPLKKSMMFTWEKANQATKYQIIFAADSNFSSYDKTKNRCLNAQTCFTYTVASTSYALNANHAMVKTEGSTYFWQVQSLNKTQRSSSSEIRTFTAGTPKPAIPPEIVKVSPTYQNVLGKQMSFTANLNVSFPQNLYSVKVNIDDGDFETMSAVTGTQFTYNFYPTELGDHHFTIAIFDKDGVIIDTLGDDFSVISGGGDNPPVSNSGYTKIANNGSTLPDSAKLGNASNDWACTKDNKTGLIWEVKTDDGGLRDKDWSYSWYKPEGDNGGDVGYQNGNFYWHPEWCKGSDCDTYAFKTAVNKLSLCGATNWRLPTNEEYFTYYYENTQKINDYFPNMNGMYYWTSTPDNGQSDFAHIKYYIDNSYTSYISVSNKDHNLGVQLVR